MAYHWSVHQLTMYFGAVSAPEDEASALQAAVEQAAESLDAEVVAVVRGGAVLTSVGLDPESLDADRLLDTAAAGIAVLPMLGACHMVVTRPSSGAPERLLAARSDAAFSAEERQIVQAMAQVLALALRALRTVDSERRLRAEKEQQAEERLRLLGEVRARERLLKHLLRIQGAVSRREPLPVVFDAVASGAADLLAGGTVALVQGGTPDTLDIVAASDRIGEDDGTVLRATVRSAVEAGEGVRERAGGRTVVAVPVAVGSQAEGGLVATLPPGTEPGDELEVLSAFAQQVSSALIDARTLEEVEEARHDHLTGLPSRALFLQRLSDALRRRSGDAQLSLLFIDLDGFKQVNDSLGHAAGDSLLVAVAQRLRRCLRDTDTPARLGGDEFAVVVRDDGDASAGLRMADRIIAAIREPFAIGEREVVVGASIGIVKVGPERTDGAALLSDADVAMYRCKKSDDGRPVLFEPSMRAAVVQRLDLQSDLRRAFQNGGLELHYQPIQRLTDGVPVAVEALLRWTHPRRGPVPPPEFVAVAEEIGLIGELGRWVLTRAARDAAAWRRAFPDLAVNINISGQELGREDYPEHVLRILSAAGVPPSAVTLELTETMLMRDAQQALAGLSMLHEVGVQLAIDDFGTGYSSLAYLRRLPVDDLKIDRAFIDRITSTTEDLAVVRTVVDLSRTLRMRTVAEGVEDAAQVDALVALGCDLGQGYHLARPMPAADVYGWLVAAHARPLPGLEWGGHRGRLAST